MQIGLVNLRDQKCNAGHPDEGLGGSLQSSGEYDEMRILAEEEEQGGDKHDADANEEWAAFCDTTIDVTSDPFCGAKQ
ncbi:hypothetical protein MKX07_000426 [Trichoderma sp. CBMAI-0711]|nr:hypothetical protein MKX07_000426 [Trichoderma sp. CBMAI-0711]